MPNRIASEDLGEVRGWMLPSIGASGNVVSTAEKEARERKQQELLRANEVVEDVPDPRLPAGPITAEMLQEITEGAEAEGFEAGKVKGEAEGRLEGYEAGKQQALQEMRQTLTQEAERLTMLANTLQHPLEVQDNALEFLLMQTVKKIAAALVKRELYTDSSHILSVLQEAIAALPVGSKNLTIYLNPDDLAVIENYAQEQNRDWGFIADTNLLPGGCRVDSKESLVDFSVETRMDALLDEFENKQLSSDEPEAVVAEAEQQARLHRQHREAEEEGGEFVAGQVSEALVRDANALVEETSSCVDDADKVDEVAETDASRLESNFDEGEELAANKESLGRNDVNHNNHDADDTAEELFDE